MRRASRREEGVSAVIVLLALVEFALLLGLVTAAVWVWSRER